MNKDKEKVIRAIVSGYVESYVSGFSDRNSVKREKNVVIDSIEKDIRYYSAISHFLNDSLNSLLEKIVIKLASLSYDTHKCNEVVKIKNTLCADSNALFNNKWLWNTVCKSTDGYEIVVDEYKKSYGYLKQAFKK